MLSHTLVETITETIRYVQVYPEIYQPHEPEIRQLVSEMESLQRKLDTPEAAVYPKVEITLDSYTEEGETLVRCSSPQYPEVIGLGENSGAAELSFKARLADRLAHVVYKF